MYIQASELNLLNRLEGAQAGESEIVDVAILPVFAEERPLLGLAGLIDWRCHGLLSKLIRDETFSGHTFETVLLPVKRISCLWRVVLLGLGECLQFSPAVAERAAEKIIDISEKLQAQRVLCSLPGERWGNEIPKALFLALKANLAASSNSWWIVADRKQVAEFGDA